MMTKTENAKVAIDRRFAHPRRSRCFLLSLPGRSVSIHKIRMFFSIPYAIIALSSGAGGLPGLHPQNGTPARYAGKQWIGGIFLGRPPQKNAYERRRTLLIRIVAAVCALLLVASVLLSAIFY